MKKYFFLLPLCMLVVGCEIGQSTETGGEVKDVKDVDVIYYKDSIVITNKFEPDSTMPDIFEPGIVEQTSNEYGSVETQMINQFADYMNALKDHNYKKAVSYVNNDALKHIQKIAERDGTHIEVEEFAQTLLEDMNEFQDTLSAHGIKFSVVVPSLLRRVDDGDNVFIVFTNTTNLTGENGKKCHLAPIEKALGVSNNKGSSWTFIDFSEDVPNYLSEKYKEEVINAIMDY